MDFEKILAHSSLDDSSLMDFIIRVSFSEETKLCRMCRLRSSGTRIVFGHDEVYLNAVAQHEPLIHSFISDTDSQKLEVPLYNGPDIQIHDILGKSFGGIVLSYNSYKVKAYRLTQTRVFWKATNGNFKKLQRCSTLDGMVSKTVFSYKDMFQRLLTDDTVEISTTLTVGSEKVKISLTPTREYAIRESIKNFRKNLRRNQLGTHVDDEKRSHSSLPFSFPTFSRQQQSVQEDMNCSSEEEEVWNPTPIHQLDSRLRVDEPSFGKPRSLPHPVESPPPKRTRSADADDVAWCMLM